MTLGEIFEGVELKAGLPEQLANTPVAGLEYDSRRIQPGFLFFAFEGARADGRKYARQALDKGAVAVVGESPPPADFQGAWIEVAHGRQALATIARNFYGKPDERLFLTGITGTNGKTTTSYLIDSVLRAAGKTTALIGTIEYHLADEILPAVNTTPESLDLFRLFAELERRGGTHVTMEVSSHALALGRSFGLRFHTGVFTNLSRDHLDFHKTMEDYFAAKRRLFTGYGAPPPPFAVLNSDDEHGRGMEVPAGTHVFRYGLDADREIRASNIVSGFTGLRFDVVSPEGSFEIQSPLVGRFNVYNILAACCTGMSYGFTPETIARGIAECGPVPGRFERIDEGQRFLVVVDYAHTDDALRNVIGVARSLSPRRVITVFGCGGDRDRTKRPLMGMAAGELSDFVVLTSDNPRSEDPLSIINDALVGLGRYDTPHVVEPDRMKAIHRAIQEAGESDIVIIAGKGHEPYQVLKDRTIDFDDREAARSVLQKLGYRK
ncbi:MAG TPA: UDP-N-acetylmuramoyl-L-alanyl-D-glutamate--2,6-diaminopimelate ligase [Bryobacteraceae bacterium]|nr:UDP-N-acetylmuramoyl-L-alanyl-D-glutamate--2,6-diaminopimelate ligase [Bryobacteraceae bacterium]